MTTPPSLMKALRELLDAHPVYRGHPSGAPNSAARAAQERAIKAEDVVRAALAAHAKQAEPQAVAVKPLRWPPECPRGQRVYGRSEEHTSELQSLMRNSYAVFCLQKKKQNNTTHKSKPTQESICRS